MISKFNYDTFSTFSDNSISEVQWWVNNIEQSVYRTITTTKRDLSIYIDASFTGYGVTDKVNPSE